MAPQSITAESISHMLDRSPPLRRAWKLNCARLRPPEAASRKTALSNSASARSHFSLERDDILAAIAYAAQQTNHVVVEVA